MAAWNLLFDVAFDTNPGTEPGALDWTDLSSRVRDQAPTTVRSGAGRLASSSAGSASLTLDNADRAVDPTNPAATYNLVPQRHARLRATIGATTYPLFRGFVEAWPPVWSSFDSTIGVRLVDGFAWLGLQDSDLDLPAQMSHERVTALLDLAGWPAELRDIGTGVIELEPLEQASANLLRSLEDVADAEVGDLYCAPDGKITFRSRHARFDQTVTATLGIGGDVGIATATPAWDPAWLTNVSRVELEDGSVFEAIDDASVLAYGARIMPTRDLPLRSAEAEAVAQWDVGRFAEMHLWVDGLTVHAEDVLPTILQRRIGDLMRVVHDIPTIDESLCLERWEHQISATSWTCRFDLSPYFGAGPWLTLDDPVLGRLDANKLAP